MKGISKAAHAGFSPLIPAVLAPPEVLTQAPRGFIPRLASTACFPASHQWTTAALWWASMASS